MFPFATIIFYAITLQLVHAVPAMKRVERLIGGPRITSPTADTVWTKGSHQQVTWDTSDIPLNASLGTLGLGRLATVSGHGQIQIQTFLTNDIPLLKGSVDVTVPTDANASHDYVVAWIADSPKSSPVFTISD